MRKMARRELFQKTYERVKDKKDKNHKNHNNKREEENKNQTDPRDSLDSYREKSLRAKGKKSLGNKNRKLKMQNDQFETRTESESQRLSESE